MTYKEENEENVKKLSKKQKQEILDLMNEGKSVGDCMKKTNLELGTVCEVITQNIFQTHHLNRVANTK